jgi:MFS family permease
MVGIPASALAGGWVDRFGRKVIGVAGLIAYVAATAALWAAPYSFAGFLVLSSALGWAGAVAWTALNTLAVEVMPALRKPVASVYNAFRFLGYAAAPPLLGILYAWQGAGAVYLVCGLVVIVAAGLMSRLPASRSALRPGML